MTVSRVINDRASVLPSTRERVEAAISDLAYVPNPAARSLAGGRQHRLALLFDNPSASFLSEYLVGALAATDRNDVLLVLERWTDGNLSTLLGRLKAQRIEAVLASPPLCDDASLVTAVRQADILFAQIATGRPDPSAIAVSIDDEGAARAMTEYLLKAGHRRIAFIAGAPGQASSELRLAGYRNALAAAQIRFDPALVHVGDYTYRSGLEGAMALLAGAGRPSAIFASNDDMAAGAVAAAHALGLQVPSGLSVCGFDDTAIATTIWPELTTIRQPIADMARRAVALVADSVDAQHGGAGTQALHERLPFTLVERLSVAAPA